MDTILYGFVKPTNSLSCWCCKKLSSQYHPESFEKYYQIYEIGHTLVIELVLRSLKELGKIQKFTLHVNPISKI